MNDEQGRQHTAEQGTIWGQLIAKCWADDSFKQKLLADPEAVLKAAGVEWPAGNSVRVLANDDKVFHLVIPAEPTDPRVGPGEGARMTQRRRGPGRRGGDDPSWG